MADFRQKIQARAEEWLSKAAQLLENFPPLSSLIAHLPKAKYPALFLIGLLCGDLVLYFGSDYLSSFAVKMRTPPPRIETEKPYLKNRQAFEESIRRSPFCPGCPVPDIKALILSRPKDCNKAKLLGNASSLKVIGTIVLSNPMFSVATVASGSNESIAIKKDDTVAGFGKVFEIHRDRICFENTEGFLGYVPIPEDKVTFGQPLQGAISASAFEGISRTSDTDIEIKRSFLLEKLNDPNILFQAQAVPYKDPNTREMKGFKVLSVVPGSVYEAMDIRGEDIIVGVNGEPMNSLQKAQELYGSAASAEEVSIEILRGGQSITKKFKVK